jgi:integrase
MRKAKLPRGVVRRGLSLCISFTFDGKLRYKVLGPESAVNVSEAIRARLNIKEQIRQGTYQHSAKPIPAVPAKPIYTVSSLWPVYLRKYQNKSGRNESRLRIAWAHLEPTFGAMRVEDVTTDSIERYIESRRAKGKSPGTVNRETATLKAMLNYGSRTTPPMVVGRVSFPERLKESAPRDGFVEDAEYDALKRNAVQTWLKGLLAIGYSFGFRKGELLSLRCGQVDLLSREIRLGTNTKTGRARTVSMTTEVYELMCECVRGKSETDFVFTRENGSPVVDFRDEWYSLCVAAKLGKYVPAKTNKGADYKRYVGLEVHDLRRSAVRNMVRAGIPEAVAMAISGHTTRAVFDRYNIVNTADIVRASEKLEQARKGAVTVVQTHTKPTQPTYALN